MTGFIIVCAVMLLAALVVGVERQLKPAPSPIKGQSALPPAFVPAVVIGLLLVIGSH